MQGNCHPQLPATACPSGQGQADQEVHDCRPSARQRQCFATAQPRPHPTTYFLNCFHRWATLWLKSTLTRRSSMTALFILK
jgi:hypothetical protein